MFKKLRKLYNFSSIVVAKRLNFQFGHFWWLTLLKRSFAKLKDVSTVSGSSKFQAMVFSPGQDQFRAATRLCICELCKSAFGSCHQFSNYTLSIAEKNKVYLRSNNAKPDQDEEDETDITDFVAAGSLVAVAADTKSGL